MFYQQPDLSTAAAIGGLILAAFALGLGLRWLWHWVGLRYPRCPAAVMDCRCKLKAGHPGVHQSMMPVLWGDPPMGHDAPPLWPVNAIRPAPGPGQKPKPAGVSGHQPSRDPTTAPPGWSPNPEGSAVAKPGDEQ